MVEIREGQLDFKGQPRARSSSFYQVARRRIDCGSFSKWGDLTARSRVRSKLRQGCWRLGRASMPAAVGQHQAGPGAPGQSPAPSGVPSRGPLAFQIVAGLEPRGPALHELSLCCVWDTWLRFHHLGLPGDDAREIFAQGWTCRQITGLLPSPKQTGSAGTTNPDGPGFIIHVGTVPSAFTHSRL